MQHVATWKEGEEKWAYHPDAFAHMDSHKVSLDPYRLESRRILACIKDALPPPPVQRVEKASIDEVFLDLSSQIHSILVERYPEISGPPPYDDPTELLPRPPTTALDWNADALVDLDHTETEDDDPDWDDIAMLVGSEIVRSVRAAIRERLKYTCSAGVARNKMIAKLGSAHKKPNQQTVVRNRAVQDFLGEFKFTKIRNLGGKLGEDVVSKFSTDQVKDLLIVSLEQLKNKIGDDTGSWVYEIIRGEDSSEVNSRTQIKSMLSAKSFRPSINTFEQATKWLRIFVSDIFSRLVEEGVLQNKRRPKTMNLHHRQGTQIRSRQAPIPTGRSLDETFLFDISKSLMGQIVVDGRAWPCSNLSLSVGGIEDGPVGNRGIGNFLVKGDEAMALRQTTRDSGLDERGHEDNHSSKRRISENGAIKRFFRKRESNNEENNQENLIAGATATNGHRSSPMVGSNMMQDESSHNEDKSGRLITFGTDPAETSDKNYSRVINENATTPSSLTRPYFCNQCSRSLTSCNRDEHEDWHFAKSLQSQENSQPLSTKSQSTLTQEPKTTPGLNGSSSFHRKRTFQGQAPKKADKTQQKLLFRT